MAPDVSIVTATFGDQEAATRVGTGLDAVQRSAGDPPAEVIVVAVGPAGRVAADQLVELTTGTSLRPEVVDVEADASYVRAINAGVAKSSGDIVVAARPLVTFHQRFLYRVRSQAGEKWDFLAPSVRRGEAKKPVGVSKRGRTYRLVDVTRLPSEAARVSAGSGACVIVRRAALEQRTQAVGGLFDDAYQEGNEDLDLFWWAERNGLVVRYVPNLFVGHAVNQEVLPSPAQRRRAMANYRVTVWKHIAEPRDALSWVLGEAAFVSEEVTVGGVSGVLRYAGSWRDSFQTARAIKRHRGRLRG